MKKHFFVVIFLLSCVTTLFAQPQKMTYQAVVRNSNNELVANSTVGIRVTIVEDVPNGPIIYRETHVAQTNANGLVSIVIGTGVHPYTTSLSDVQWARHDHYFQVEIDLQGGTNYTIAGTQQLMSVPYSFHSGSAVVAEKSDTASYAVSANIANTANTATMASMANTANMATYADTAYFLVNAQNSDTAKFAYNADTAVYANVSYTSNMSNTANYADSARISNYANSANIANTATMASMANTANMATYADTAYFLVNAQNSDTAKFAYNADTAVYANVSYTSNMSNTANYADSARISNYANSANTANSAISAQTANYADSSDFNNLLNRPKGTNKGDILYWEISDSSWRIVPAGTTGEVLTMDADSVPRWHSGQTVTLATLTTDSVISIGTTTARIVSNVSNDGGSAFVFSGVCWDTTPAPTTANYHTLDGIGTGSFVSNMSGLTMGTQYHARAFATNSVGTAYGNEIIFTTQTYPTVITAAVSNVTITTAVSGGNVTDDGGAPVTERGVCWSTSPNPTIADSHTSDGTGTGAFTSNMMALAHYTKYYVRAYATNIVGTAYGDTVSFTTVGLPPTVTTTAPSNITGTTAEVGGDVIDDGWVTVTERGICWNTTGNPTMADNVVASGNDIGNFTASITGLTPETMYYVRAYAINSVDTSYGTEKSFQTKWTCGFSTVVDYDNNIYPTLQLGTQCWMKENLRTTHYSNGASITLGSSTNSTTAYRYYPDNDVNNVLIYGYLYNWAAVMNGAASSSANPSEVQGICPKDWHVPSHDEWTQLTDYVSSQGQYLCSGTSTYIAKALSSKNGWKPATTTDVCYPSINTYDNDKTGFDGLPAGLYNGSSTSYFGEWAGWWSCTVSNGNYIHRRSLLYDSASVTISTSDKYYGRSVRCLKD